MKKIISFLVLTFLLLSLSGFAQGSKVTPDTPTLSEKKQNEISNQRSQVLEELHGLEKKLGISGNNKPSTYNFSSWQNVQKMQNWIKVYKEYLQKLASNPKLFELSKKYDNLSVQIGQKTSMYNNLLNSKSRVSKAITDAENRIKEIQQGKAKEESATQKHNEDLKNLDAELSNSKTKSKSLDDELKSLTSKSSNKSLDDFLATKKTTKSTSGVDFLAENSSKSNNSGDFLAGSSKSSTNVKDYKIEYKEGLYGVVSSSGKVLIPFKKWEIEEYKFGIAKVTVELESYEKKANSYGGYKAIIYKKGFVDNTGNFIDGYEVDYSITKTQGTVMRGLTLVRGNDNRSYDEIQRAKKERERKTNLEFAEAKNEVKQWAINKIKQYQQ